VDLTNTSPCLDAAKTKHVQEVISILLYYACAVDSTLLAVLGTIATQQAKGTKATMEAITQLLNYCAAHPNATICYQASDMILWIHSDALYLTAPKGWSHVAGHHFLSSCQQNLQLCMTHCHLTMDPSTFCAKSCNLSLPVPPKPN